jgi:hypothetical protein
MGFNSAFKGLINGYNISEPAVPSSSILCRHTTTNCGQSVTLRLVPCRSMLYEETSVKHRKLRKNNTFIARFQVFSFWLRFTSPVTWLRVMWLISDDSWELATCILCVCAIQRSPVVWTAQTLRMRAVRVTDVFAAVTLYQRTWHCGLFQEPQICGLI